MTTHVYKDTVWTVGAVVPSLDPESTTLYVVGQCRSVGPKAVRWQWPGHELTSPVSDKFGAWVATLPGGWKSLASGVTSYWPVQARPENGAVSSIRVRVPGPTPYNRPYGACVVLTAESLAPLVHYFTATLTPTEDTL